jgi:hypothetical protein
VIIALVIWIFLPEDTEGWRPYTFDEELAALKAKRAIPDEENAAIIYNQLFESLDTDSNQPEFFSKSTREPWRAKDHPELAQWLRQHGNTIAKLIEASKIEKCQFPINASILSISDDTIMDRLALMRKLVYLLISAANNDIAEGRIDQALEKYIAVLQMGSHQCQQLSLLDFLVGWALEELSTNQLKRFIVTGDATEEHLAIIKRALAEIRFNWNSDLPRILDHEKLVAKGFWGMFYAINPEGKTRLSRDPTATMRAEFPEELPTLTYWQRKLAKTGTVLGWFGMPSTPQKAAKIIDAKYERFYAMARPDFDWNKQPAKPSRWIKLNYRYFVELLVKILEPAYYKIHDGYLRTIAQQRGSRLIIALRRYKNKTGHWPERLDDVKPLAPAEIFVDPINGSSFVYKPTEENFTLYSKGKNNIDEDGKEDDWDEEKTEADDWLIWPVRSCKAKEESRDAEQQ